MTAEIAEQIAEVPERFQHADRSTACLLEDAGFPELRGAVSVEGIAEVLKEHPELVDLWMERRADQRLVGGWGIECEGDAYRIQCFSGGEHLVVSDRIQACAEFIVRYVRFIGDVQARARAKAQPAGT